jgi:hypothetical protein
VPVSHSPRSRAPLSVKTIQDAINAVHSDDATPFNHLFMADGKSFAAAWPRACGDAAAT